MRYKPERALTPQNLFSIRFSFLVEMRYKPERALTRISVDSHIDHLRVEMRYKPERALTLSILVSTSSILTLM